jgi:hypothetical protein
MKYESKFKTLRHIETVRNYLNCIIKELLDRSVNHDQSKLQSPEAEIFEIYTHKLKDCTYNSDEYKQFLVDMKPALDHHYEHNRHHPEHNYNWVCNTCFTVYKRYYKGHDYGYSLKPNVCEICGNSHFSTEPDISQMTLIDLIEMLCDWKASTLRHKDGDIFKSLEINKKRFNISDQLYNILKNTMCLIEGTDIEHH